MGEGLGGGAGGTIAGLSFLGAAESWKPGFVCTFSFCELFSHVIT